jgi:hypothetical protein
LLTFFLGRFLQRDAREAEGRPIEELITVDPVSGLKILPHWLSQPYIRAQPKIAAKAEQNAEKAEEAVAKGGEACCAPGKVYVRGYPSSHTDRALFRTCRS